MLTKMDRLALLLRRTRSELTSSGLHIESIGLFILWVMYLIGGAIATVSSVRHYWRHRLCVLD